MRYYPLNRVKTNQRTSGGEFTLNGVEYSGPYYETYNGQVFSGADPVQGPSQPLARIQLELTRTLKETNATSNNLVTSQESNIYDNINPKLQPIKAFLTPQPYFPQPTDTDSKRGSIIRYFAKKRDRAGYVFEINKETIRQYYE